MECVASPWRGRSRTIKSKLAIRPRPCLASTLHSANTEAPHQAPHRSRGPPIFLRQNLFCRTKHQHPTHWSTLSSPSLECCLHQKPPPSDFDWQNPIGSIIVSENGHHLEAPLTKPCIRCHLPEPLVHRRTGKDGPSEPIGHGWAIEILACPCLVRRRVRSCSE